MMKQRKGLTTQIVRAKENLKLSHGGSSYRKVSGTNPLIKAIRQCHLRAMKEETIALNRDWV